ncbi:MAG TPA: hypothetical protein VKQ72_18200 [Aggregatilineales bacterium]|nr:hypothetical protein [Aggregatilineales bacterium]
MVARPEPEDDFDVEDNPYMAAKSYEEMQAMESALYAQCWRDGKLIPEMEDYYNHQMVLFEQALSTLFPEHYYHPRKN